MSTESNSPSHATDPLRESLFTWRGKLAAYEEVGSFVGDVFDGITVSWLAGYAREQVSFYENSIKAIESEVGK